MEIGDVCMNKLDIAKILLSDFKIKVFGCKRIPDTSSKVYCLDTNKGMFALKEYPTEVALETIVFETEICSFLTLKGYTVPEHIQNISGMKIIPFGNHYFTVYPWILGVRQPFHSGTIRQSLQCAELYGRLVRSLEEFPVLLKKKEAFNRSDEAIDKSIREHEKILLIAEDDSIRRDLRTKLEFLHKLKAEKWKGFECITWKNSHGDYNSYQILFEGEIVSGLLDFTSVRRMPVIYELFRSFLYIRRGFEDGLPDMREFAEYLRSYKKYESLNIYDIQFAVRCYYLRVLKTVFGYQQYIVNSENVRYLRLGQDLFKQCVLIHDNEEQLTACLCKEMNE